MAAWSFFPLGVSTSFLSRASLGTVSRVLNNQPNVSEQARKTILALVEEHGFERNASAQLLKQQRTKSVLIIVKGTSNEMFAAMVEKLQSLFADTDHPVIADFIDEDENEVKRAVQLCRERKPSGVLFLGGNNENFRADFDKVLVPSVVVTNDAHELRFPNLSSVSTGCVVRGGVSAQKRAPEYRRPRRRPRDFRHQRQTLRRVRGGVPEKRFDI